MTTPGPTAFRAGFIEWLAAKDPADTFDPYVPQNCALAQYSRTLFGPGEGCAHQYVDSAGKWHDYPDDVYTALMDCDFGPNDRVSAGELLAKLREPT